MAPCRSSGKAGHTTRRAYFTAADQYLSAYVMDLWVRQWQVGTAQGEMMVMRYADDSVLGF